MGLDTGILFYHQAQTHTLMGKKTRNSKSKNKILYGRHTFLVHVQNWEKIIVKNQVPTLKKDISVLRESWGLTFWQGLHFWTNVWNFWKSEVDFSYFGLFCFDFPFHRSQSLEGVEQAVRMCTEVFVSILIFFKKNVWISPIMVFFCFDFQFHHSHNSEGAEWAVWMCTEIVVSRLIIWINMENWNKKIITG